MMNKSKTWMGVLLWMFVGILVSSILTYFLTESAPESRLMLKLSVLLNSLLTFGLPAWWYIRREKMEVSWSSTPKQIVWGVAFFVIAIFFWMQPITILSTEVVVWLEEQIPWLASGESINKAILARVLVYEGVWELMLNVLVISLVPALVEEVLFRVVLHRVLEKKILNPHYLAWITGFAFSIFHMNLQALLPIFTLGVALSYVWQHTRSFGLIVLLHAGNNLIGLLIPDSLEVRTSFSETEIYMGVLYLVIGVGLGFLGLKKARFVKA